MRGLAYTRDVRNKAIARKKRICKELDMTWYNVDGKYSKGKIHCGCPLCKPTKGYLPSTRLIRQIELSRDPEYKGI